MQHHLWQGWVISFASPIALDCHLECIGMLMKSIRDMHCFFFSPDTKTITNAVTDMSPGPMVFNSAVARTKMKRMKE